MIRRCTLNDRDALKVCPAETEALLSETFKTGLVVP
jgi:hypothetical protein